MKFNQARSFLVLVISLVSAQGFSQSDLQSELQSELSSELPSELPSEKANDGLVEVEQLDTGSGEVSFERVVDLNAPYRQRRGKHGVLFGVGAEKFYPKEMLSLLDDVSIDDILDKKPIDLLSIELGYKYNFTLGAVTLAYGYATGSAVGSFNNASRKIGFKRQNVTAGYYADTIFNEPWVVPYAVAGITQFIMEEEESTAATIVAEDSIRTGFSLNYKAGFMFQLNWIESGIDSTTHSDGLRSSGLENTYLDVFVSWYDPTQDLYDPNNALATKDSDPNLNAEAQLGLGLKLEF